MIEIDYSDIVEDLEVTDDLTIGDQLLLPLDNDPVNPTIAFGDGDTGFYESADDVISISVGGVRKWLIEAGSFYSVTNDAAVIIQTTPSATVPNFIPARNDLNTGIGHAAADALSLIAGGVEGVRITEAGGAIDVTVKGDMALEAALHLVLPLHNDAATPTLAFGDGDTGFYENSDDTIVVSTAANARFYWTANSFKVMNGNGPQMENIATTATVPGFIPNQSDPNTGIGSAAADQLSFIAGGVEGHRITEAAGVIVHTLTGTLNDIALGAAKHLVLPLHDDAATPTLAFGDGDSGFYEKSDDTIAIATGGVERFFINTTGDLRSTTNNNWVISNSVPTATNPVFRPDNVDINTGIGHAAADQLSLIAGGVEGHRITETGSAITHELTGTVNNNSAKMAVIASGNYAGNDTANTAIAHGLGVIPQYVKIYISSGELFTLMKIGEIGYLNAASDGAFEVTNWTTTNFYVGNATSYGHSANATGTTYYWVAYG